MLTVKGNLYMKLEKSEAANIINGIEIRLLKEFSANKHSFSFEDYLKILVFFTQQNSGSIKLYFELENRIVNYLKDSEITFDKVPIRTFGKLAYSSIMVNSLNKIYYNALNEFILRNLKTRTTLEPKELTDLIDINYLLARKYNVQTETLMLMLKHISASQFTGIGLEHIINLVWTLLLKTRITNVKYNKLPIEDINIEDISEELKMLITELNKKMIERGLMSLEKMPNSTKYRLKQIGLVIAKANIDLNVVSSLTSTLSTLKAKDQKPEVSLVQEDVSIVLKVMNITNFEMEKEILLGPVDIFIPPNFIMEINGPSHFIGYDHDCKLEDLDGKTLMKYKILALYNYQVRFIPYKTWYEIKGVTNRMNYISEKMYLHPY